MIAIKSFLRVGWIGLILAGTMTGTVRSQVSIDLIAESEDAIPGTGTNLALLAFVNAAVLNPTGRVALVARLSDGQACLLTGTKAAWQLVALSGGSDPALPSGLTYLSNPNAFGFQGTLAYNEAGQLCFGAYVAGTGVSTANDQVYLTGFPGAFQMVLREDNQVPDLAAGIVLGTQNSAPINLAINQSGMVFASGILDGASVTTTNDSALWSGAPGALNVIAREGNPAGALPEGVLGRVDQNTAFNDSGQVAFVSRPGGVGSPVTNYSIWSGSPGALQVMARTGLTAPDSDGARFQNLGVPALNRSGQIAFSGTLSGPSVDASNDSAIWASSSQALVLAAREGDPAPGAEAGVVFGPLQNVTAQFNALGHVAFAASLTGPGITDSNNRGIWAGPPGELRLVARESLPAPGDCGNFLTMANPLLNDLGQVAFSGTATDGLNTCAALWASDPSGRLLAVLTNGTTLDLGGGQTRTVNLLAPGTAFASRFNARGQFLYTAGVTDAHQGLLLVEVTASESIRIVDAFRADSDILIQFTTTAGQSYRIEHSPTVPGEPGEMWFELPDLILGTGQTMTVTNQGVAHLPARFYRIKRL